MAQLRLAVSSWRLKAARQLDKVLQWHQLSSPFILYLRKLHKCNFIIEFVLWNNVLAVARNLYVTVKMSWSNYPFSNEGATFTLWTQMSWTETIVCSAMLATLVGRVTKMASWALFLSFWHAAWTWEHEEQLPLCQSSAPPWTSLLLSFLLSSYLFPPHCTASIKKQAQNNQQTSCCLMLPKAATVSPAWLQLTSLAQTLSNTCSLLENLLMLPALNVPASLWVNSNQVKLHSDGDILKIFKVNHLQYLIQRDWEIS